MRAGSSVPRVWMVGAARTGSRGRRSRARCASTAPSTSAPTISPPSDRSASRSSSSWSTPRAVEVDLRCWSIELARHERARPVARPPLVRAPRRDRARSAPRRAARRARGARRRASGGRPAFRAVTAGTSTSSQMLPSSTTDDARRPACPRGPTRSAGGSTAGTWRRGPLRAASAGMGDDRGLRPARAAPARGRRRRSTARECYGGRVRLTSTATRTRASSEDPRRCCRGPRTRRR